MKKRGSSNTWKKGKLGESVWSFLKKLKVELPYDPPIPLDKYAEKTGSNLKGHTHPNVHDSTLYKSQDVGATPLCIRGETDEEGVGHNIQWASMRLQRQ